MFTGTCFLWISDFLKCSTWMIRAPQIPPLVFSSPEQRIGWASSEIRSMQRAFKWWLSRRQSTICTFYQSCPSSFKWKITSNIPSLFKLRHEFILTAGNNYEIYATVNCEIFWLIHIQRRQLKDGICNDCDIESEWAPFKWSRISNPVQCFWRIPLPWPDLKRGLLLWIGAYALFIQDLKPVTTKTGWRKRKEKTASRYVMQE